MKGLQLAAITALNLVLTSGPVVNKQPGLGVRPRGQVQEAKPMLK